MATMQINGSPETDFQETEIGLIPVDWDLLAVSQVAEIILGQSPPSSTYNDEGIGLPFFQGKAEFGLRYPTVVKWCDDPQRISEKNDILMSVRAPVGDVNISPYTCCIGRGLAAIRAGELTTTLFLYFMFFHAQSRLEREGTGSTFKSINKSILTNFPIPLPPLAEQRRIAAVLNVLQDEIAAQADIIREMREFKRSTMERLFTYGVGDAPVETKMTEIGEIPIHWDVDDIGERCDLKSGNTPKRSNDDYWDGGTIPWVKTGEIDYKVITFTEEHITEQALAETSLKLLPPNTLLLAMYGQGITRGKVGILGIDATINQACLAIMPKDETVSTEYLFHYLSHAYLRLRGHSHGTQQANLSGRIVASIPIAIPPENEQKTIVELLDDINEKIAAEEDRKAAMQAFFRSALDQLMTGQIRLLNDENLETLLS